MRLATTLAILLGVTLAVVAYGCTRQSPARYEVILVGPDGQPRNIWETESVYFRAGFCTFRPTDDNRLLAVSGTVLVLEVTGLSHATRERP